MKIAKSAQRIIRPGIPNTKSLAAGGMALITLKNRSAVHHPT